MTWHNGNCPVRLASGFLARNREGWNFRVAFRWNVRLQISDVRILSPRRRITIFSLSIFWLSIFRLSTFRPTISMLTTSNGRWLSLGLRRQACMTRGLGAPGIGWERSHCLESWRCNRRQALVFRFRRHEIIARACRGTRASFNSGFVRGHGLLGWRWHLLLRCLYRCSLLLTSIIVFGPRLSWTLVPRKIVAGFSDGRAAYHLVQDTLAFFRDVWTASTLARATVINV